LLLVDRLQNQEVQLLYTLQQLPIIRLGLRLQHLILLNQQRQHSTQALQLQQLFKQV
jgi:hypothetical protein